MQEGRPDLDGFHAAFASEKTGQWDFKLTVGEEEDALRLQLLVASRNGFAGSCTRGRCDGFETFGVDAEFGSDGGEPSRCAFFPKRERSGEMACTSTLQCGSGVAKERLGDCEDGVRAYAGNIFCTPRGENADAWNAEVFEKLQCLIFDHVGKCADNNKLPLICFRHGRHQGGEARVFALSESGFDAGAAEVYDLCLWRILFAQTFSGAFEIKFDDFRRAGANQKELPDVRSS